MSVQYRVVFKDRKSFRAQGICFGKMGVLRWRDQRLINPDSPNGMFSHAVSTELINRSGKEQDYIDFELSYGINNEWMKPVGEHGDGEYPPEYFTINNNHDRWQYALKLCGPNYFKEMKLLLEELPMYKSWVKVHPKLGVIRFHLGKRKADEVMVAMSLFRNLGNYRGYISAYKEMVNRGYTRLFAVVTAHLINMEFCKSAFSGEYTCYYQGVRTGEYNWFSPDTIGAQGMMNILLQRTEKFNYFQDTWKNNRGYFRDSYFRDNGIIFDERYHGAYFDWAANSRDQSRERDAWGDQNIDNYNPCRYRKMVDAFSIPGDEPIPGVQGWNEVNGFYLLGPMTPQVLGHSFYVPTMGNICHQDAEAAISALADFAEVHGYNPKY